MLVSVTLKQKITVLIVGWIFLACLLMNSLMRGGLPIDNSLIERMAFIANNQFVWAMCWLVWMFAALGLLLFCLMLADELPPCFLRIFACALVSIGIAPDLIAEVVYAFVLPMFTNVHTDQQIFSLLEIIAARFTGFLGNGLYNLGGLLLTVLAIRHKVVSGWIAYSGIAAWILGLLLSVSIAINSMKLAEMFTILSMTLSTLWMLVIAHVRFGR